MNKWELIRLSWENLWRMKFRTILTIIGVVIGTSSIIVMVSIGNGAQKSITEELSGIGSITTLQVYQNSPSSEGAKTRSARKEEKPVLNDSAIENFKKIPGVVTATPVFNLGGAELSTGRDQFYASLMGVDYDVLDELSYNTSSGEKPKSNEKNSIILGKDVLASSRSPMMMMETGEEANTVAPEDLIGKKVNLTLGRTDDAGEEETKTVKVKVVGILEGTGGSEDYSIISDIGLVSDLNEWILGKPVNTKKDGYAQAFVAVENSEVVNDVMAAIEVEEFTVFSMKQILDSMGSVFQMLQILLGGIGGVALLVACIGIVNTMTMSIYERTKEIGIMKVIGASVVDIRNMFIVESTMIGLMGGIVGSTLSYLLSLLINFVAKFFISEGNVSISYITPGLIIFALVFSAIVGLLSGVRPAIKAANLSSLDAIRSE